MNEKKGIEVKRIFHPVKRDAFYTEEILRKDGEIRLLSESLLKISPIILDEKDLQYLNYLIMGTVVRVIKSNE
ncbi:MAG: hypothetical protein PHY30_00030 [Candidatus Pacebacteria bacterium]|nr:hypothetical protein [Candidatus Paceibacterota bacterium]